VVLAESLGSIASNLVIDGKQYVAVGQNISAHHLRPGISGYLNGKCTPQHLGKKTHVWDIELTNDEGKKICICRLTMAIVDKPK